MNNISGRLLCSLYLNYWKRTAKLRNIYIYRALWSSNTVFKYNFLYLPLSHRPDSWINILPLLAFALVGQRVFSQWLALLSFPTSPFDWSWGFAVPETQREVRSVMYFLQQQFSEVFRRIETLEIRFPLKLISFCFKRNMSLFYLHQSCHHLSV